MTNDENYRRDYSDSGVSGGPGRLLETPLVETLQQVVRLCGTFLGFVLVVLGLMFVLKLFNVIVTTLHAPGNIHAIVDRWAALIGGEGLRFTLEGQDVALGQLAAVGIVGVGGLVLVSIAFRLITTGAHVIAITLGERQAMKQLLRHVLPRGSNTTGLLFPPPPSQPRD